MKKFFQKIVERKISGKTIFLVTGIVSTIWFLIRVMPKPQRAFYPCMKAAAPIMSSFVIYILTLSGSVFAFRKAKQKFIEAKYLAAIIFLGTSVSFASLYLIKSSRVSQAAVLATGPDDGPNESMGTALGINPGRVVWAWNPGATSGNPDDETVETYHFLSKYNNQDIYDEMFKTSVIKLTGADSVAGCWDKLFRYHNNKKGKGDVPYTAGEKILIKINQVTSTYMASESDGFSSYPSGFSGAWKIAGIGATMTTPQVVLSILRQLVNEAGVAQEDIYVGDPIGHIYSHNYDVWHGEFPDIHYIDKSTSEWGRTKINPTANSLVFYSDKGMIMPDAVSDKLYDVIEEADYMINVANLKAHMRAGFTANTKNHFGSHSRDGANHIHPALVAPEEGYENNIPNPSNINNTGYGKYRVFVDLMGSKYLGGNTVLFVIDGFWGSGYHDQRGPVKWKSAPFNNDWCNSLFISQDPVAIESVIYDFIRSEFNGINQGVHNSPNWYGVDDYLHQAADKSNWPESIKYAPNGDDVELKSLGVHEHWNDNIKKQYTKNLYPDTNPDVGIELVSIPDTLVKYGNVTTGSDISNSDKEAEIVPVNLYPVPVRDYAVVSFILNKREYVEINIFDINGKLIKTLTKGQFVGSGKHEFTLDMNDIKSGNYICKINIGNSIYNKKISVINY